MPLPSPTRPSVLILTVPHGAAHARAAQAIQKALLQLDPTLSVQVEDALAHCAGWFRRYYNAYEIPLRYCPGLWRFIENLQQSSRSTGPAWLYRQGAKPLFRWMENLQPSTVVATEVGLCELVSLYKRQSRATFRLVAVELMDFYPAWVQPEVDLYLTSHPDLSAELMAAAAPAEKIVCSGQPIDPAFLALPSRDAVRSRLSLSANAPLLLVLFGGGGYGHPRPIASELRRVASPLDIVFVAGRNPRLEEQLRRLSRALPRARVLGWVNNLHEWMVAADLMLSKPGGNTLAEGFACGLPLLAFDPLPGNEERTCRWIERWQAGIWIRRARDIAPTLQSLLDHPEALAALRRRVQTLARPQAALDAAKAILTLRPTQPARR